MPAFVKAVLLGLIVFISGCGLTPSPTDQFKSLSDAKKDQLELLTASKNSDILGLRGHGYAGDQCR